MYTYDADAVEASGPAVVASDTMASSSSRSEDDQLEDLKAFLWGHRHSVNVLTMLQDMPEDLRNGLTSNWPETAKSDMWSRMCSLATSEGNLPFSRVSWGSSWFWAHRIQTLPSLDPCVALVEPWGRINRTPLGSRQHWLNPFGSFGRIGCIRWTLCGRRAASVRPFCGPGPHWLHSLCPFGPRGAPVEPF